MWPDDNTPEPAAWINFNAATSERNVSFVCESELASIPLWPEPSRGQRKPLTDDEIMQRFHGEVDTPVDVSDAEMIDFARAVEKAHGIGGEHD